MFSELWGKNKDIKIIECIILIYFYMNIFNKIVNFCYYIGKWNNKIRFGLFILRKWKVNFWWFMLICCIL